MPARRSRTPWVVLLVVLLVLAGVNAVTTRRAQQRQQARDDRVAVVTTVFGTAQGDGSLLVTVTVRNDGGRPVRLGAPLLSGELFDVRSIDGAEDVPVGGTGNVLLRLAVDCADVSAGRAGAVQLPVRAGAGGSATTTVPLGVDAVLGPARTACGLADPARSARIEVTPAWPGAAGRGATGRPAAPARRRRP
ncbi:MAG: hypothetical protein LC789_12985 [Actinobacteria bacterium]|nr:hypothetical protein [Actinomycetota bacterium]